MLTRAGAWTEAAFVSATKIYGLIIYQLKYRFYYIYNNRKKQSNNDNVIID